MATAQKKRVYNLYTREYDNRMSAHIRQRMLDEIKAYAGKPSQEDVARCLGVSRHTINGHFKALFASGHLVRQDGYIRGRAYYIADSKYKCD